MVVNVRYVISKYREKTWLMDRFNVIGTPGLEVTCPFAWRRGLNGPG